MAYSTALLRGRPLNVRGGLLTALIFLPPALVLFTLFVILPIGEAAWYGFFNWNGLALAEHFVGLENYRQLIGNKVFGRAFINNLLIILVSLTVQLPLALAMAVLLADRLFGAVAFRMLFFLPYILADVAAGSDLALHVRRRLRARSRRPGRPSAAPRSTSSPTATGPMSRCCTVIVWKYFGFHMMLYIAGLQSIDRNLYEAAAIDGASGWQRFRYITVPGLAPMIKLSVFFSLLGSLQFFDMIVSLTGGGPLNTTHTMVSFLYYFGIGRMRVGFGSAVGVILFILCATVAFTYKRLLMRDE